MVGLAGANATVLNLLHNRGTMISHSNFCVFFMSIARCYFLGLNSVPDSEQCALLFPCQLLSCSNLTFFCFVLAVFRDCFVVLFSGSLFAVLLEVFLR